MNKLTLLLCVVLLPACSLIPEYVRHDMPVPQAWPKEPTTQSKMPDQANPAWNELAWKEFFTDLTLQNLIQKALENNRDLRVAALNIAVARSTLRVAGADLLPKVDAGMSGTGLHTPIGLSQSIPQEARTTHQYNANLGLTAFELDLFGRLRSLNQQAMESYLATTEARNATQITLIAEVANAYLNLLGDRKQLLLIEKTLATRQKYLELIERRLDRGMSNGLDRAQALTTIEASRANRVRYIRLVEQDSNALQLLVGTPINKTSMLGELDTMQLVQDLPVGLPSDVLLGRPDIMQAEHTLKGINANIGAARAAFLPRISLTVLVGLASPALNNLFDSDSRTWSFVPSVTVPIFDAGRNEANLEGAKANRDIAIARYERAIQVAFREVSDGLIARATLVSQVEAQSALVEATETSYRLSDARYRQGLESYLAVLDAERSLYSAQQDLIQLQVQRLSNLVTLYKVLGGGRV